AEPRPRPHRRAGDARGGRRGVGAAARRLQGRSHRGAGGGLTVRPTAVPRPAPTGAQPAAPQHGGSVMLGETLLMAWREIRRNALRSFLTMLGVVIGVGAVIVLVTLGEGASAKVKS